MFSHENAAVIRLVALLHSLKEAVRKQKWDVGKFKKKCVAKNHSFESLQFNNSTIHTHYTHANEEESIVLEYQFDTIYRSQIRTKSS